MQVVNKAGISKRDLVLLPPRENNLAFDPFSANDIRNQG